MQLLTYHNAKGLEWPIVILTELESDPRGNPFRLVAESEVDPDWRDPLVGRVLRYWPWPYGDQSKDVWLDTAASASAEGIAALQSERLERTRLLYVGLTRACDYVILALTGGAPKWLAELVDANGVPLVQPRGDQILVGARAFAARAAIPTAPAASEGDAVLREFGPANVLAVSHPPLRIQPSAARFDGKVTLAEQHNLGPRLALAGGVDMQVLGEACHRFFASDGPAQPIERRTRQAEDILRRWGTPHLAPHDLVSASDRLHAFLATRFDGARPLREWPIHAVVDHQIIVGRLDLLVDLGDAFVIIDHKSFPGVIEIDPDRLAAFGGQASLYARALRIVTGKSCAQYWLHQPIAGVITRVNLMPAA